MPVVKPMLDSMRLRRWIAAHTMPLVVVGFYGLLWAIQLIPPHVDYFVWQRWALAVAVALSWWALLSVLLFAGMAAFVLIVLAFMLDELVGVGEPESYIWALIDPDFAANRWYVALWVLLALWIIWKVAAFAAGLWRADPHWKVVCWFGPLSVLAVYAGLALGLRMSVTVESTCDYTVNDDDWLRLTSFRGDSSEPQYTFVEHRTAGKSWRQTAYIHDHVRLLDAGCSRINSLERDLVWFWTESVVIVSQDGGGSWYRYEVESEPLLYSGIKDVKFRDVRHGTMTVVRTESEYGWEEIFRTTDGGRTWMRAN
jgi:hypothetical protein